MSHRILNFNCPWCNGNIEVKESELNCKIFRHAIYKTTHQQINPHAPKHECEDLVSKGKVYGCAKQFKVITTENGYEVEKINPC